MWDKKQALFTSEKQDWETPDTIFNSLNQEFHFDIDIASSKSNAKCNKFFTKDDDALSKDWSTLGNVFCNPPYNELPIWVEKAYQESLIKHDGVIVLLITARPETVYWHKFIFKKAEIRFIKGRLKFSNAKSSAPFPSAIVIYHPQKTYQSASFY